MEIIVLLGETLMLQTGISLNGIPNINIVDVVASGKTLALLKYIFIKVNCQIFIVVSYIR